MVPKVPILPNWTSNRWGGLWSQVFPLHPSGATFYINSQRVYSHQPPAFIHESFKTKPLEMYVRRSFALLLFHQDTTTSLHTFSHELKDINYNLCACPNRNSTKIATPCKDHIYPMDHLKIRTEDEDGEKFLFHIFLVLSFDFGARDIFVCLCRGWLAFF